jgi:hypothetical protein
MSRPAAFNIYKTIQYQYSTFPAPRGFYEYNAAIDGVSDASHVIQAVVNQPGLTAKLNEVFHGMGLGHDVCSALGKVHKRGIDELSTPKSASSLKKLQVQKAPYVTINHAGLTEAQKEKQQEGSYTQTCICCNETRHINQYPKYLPSSSCTHGRVICRMCVIAWIRSQVQDGKLPRCALCDGAVSYAYVKYITKKQHDNNILSR